MKSMRRPRSSQSRENNPLLASATVIIRALESPTPSRPSILRFLSQALQVFEETHEQYQAAKNRSKHFLRPPGAFRHGKNRTTTPAQAAADTCTIQTYESATRALLEAVFWCLARIGGRGGPIRRIALLLLRKAIPVTGPGIILRLGEDLRSQLIVPKKFFTVDDAKPSMYVEKDRASVSAALLLLAEVSNACVSGRFQATDSVYLMLGSKMKQKATKDDLALSLALVMETFPKSMKTEERILEKCIEFARSPTFPKHSSNGIGCAILVAQAVAKLRVNGPSYCDAVAESCIRNLRASVDPYQRKIWGIAFARAVVSSILATKEIANAESILNGPGHTDKQSVDRYPTCDIDDAIFQTALGRVTRIPDVRKGEPGVLWIVATLVRMWFLALPESQETILSKAVKILGKDLQSLRTLKAAAKSLEYGIFELIVPTAVPATIHSLIPYLSKNHLISALSLNLTAYLIRSHKLNLFDALDTHRINTDEIIEACNSSLSADLACVRAAAVEVIRALASAKEELRARLFTSALQNLRIADLQLATRETGGGPKDDNRNAPATLLGNAAALGTLIEECAPYPGLPSDLVSQSLKDALSLFHRHPLATKKFAVTKVTTLRKLAGWILLAALAKSTYLESFGEDYVSELLVLWRKDLGQVPTEEGRSEGEPDEENAAFQSTTRIASLSALVAFVKRSQGEGLDTSFLTSMGAVAARLGVAEAQIALLSSGKQGFATAIDSFYKTNAAGMNLQSQKNEFLDAESHIVFTESSHLLEGIRAFPPSGVFADVCHHLACTAIVAAQSSMQYVTDDIVSVHTSPRKQGMAVKGLDRNFFQDCFTHMAYSKYADYSGLRSTLVSLEAVGAIVTADISRSNSLLSYAATASVNGNFSPFLSSLLALSVSKGVSVKDISDHPAVRESLKTLLRSGMRGISKHTVSNEAEIDDGKYLHEIAESYIGRSWIEFLRFLPEFFTSSRCLSVRSWKSLVCTIGCATAYKELGMKAGTFYWIELATDLLQILETRAEQNKSDGYAQRFMNALFAMGSLHGAMPHEYDGQKATEVNKVATETVTILMLALRDHDPMMRIAASYAISQLQSLFPSHLEYFLVSLAESLALEVGYGSQESCSRTAENYYLVSESFIRCWNGMEDTDTLPFSTFGLQGTGMTLKAIAASASSLVHEAQVDGAALSVSSRSAAYEIAYEAIEWSVSAFPEIVSVGLECLTNIWSFDVDHARRPSGGHIPFSLEQFLKPQFTNSASDMKPVLLDILSNRQRQVSLIPPRKALVQALSVLARAFDVELILSAFPSLPQDLLWMVDNGIPEACDLLRQLGRSITRNLQRHTTIFTSWLDIGLTIISSKTEATETGKGTDEQVDSAEGSGRSNVEPCSSQALDHNPVSQCQPSCWVRAAVVKTVRDALVEVSVVNQEVENELSSSLETLIQITLEAKCLESLTLLETIVSRTSPSALYPYAERISSIICNYSKSSNPIAMELVTNVAVAYLLKVIEGKDHIEDAESTVNRSILDAVVGENSLMLPLRYSCDRFAESTGVSTILRILCRFCPLIRKSIDCKCQICISLKGILPLLIICLADFALLQEPSRESTTSCDSTSKTTCVPVSTFSTQLTTCIADFSCTCIRALAGSILFECESSQAVHWPNWKSIGTLAYSADSIDTIALVYPIVTWAILEKLVSTTWIHSSFMAKFLVETSEKMGSQAAREILIAIYRTNHAAALELCEQTLSLGKVVPKILQDVMFYMAVKKWCSFNMFSIVPGELRLLTTCMSIVAGVGYINESIGMMLKIMQVAEQCEGPSCGIAEVLESKEVSSLIVDVLTRSCGPRGEVAQAKLLCRLCTLAVSSPSNCTKGTRGRRSDEAWAAVQILLKMYCQLDKEGRQSLLGPIIASLMQWVGDCSRKTLVSSILATVASDDQEVFRGCALRLGEEDRSFLEAVIKLKEQSA